MKLLLSKLDPHTVTAIAGAAVGLAVTDGLITNDTGKIITGFVTAAVALGVLIYGSVKHKNTSDIQVAQAHADAAVASAQAYASQTVPAVEPPLPPPAAPLAAA